jgi:DNA-binding response OmpR family regulator
MTDDKPHIMLVEDEIHLARGICFNLEEEGFRVSHFASAEPALASIEIERFDLVILDVMLPGMDGFHACRAIRAIDPRVPILMLTARSEDADRVEGLENGADDYLTKPFNLVEFLLRVKGMLRRSSWYRPDPVEEGYRFGDNEVFLLS